MYLLDFAHTSLEIFALLFQSRIIQFAQTEKRKIIEGNRRQKPRYTNDKVWTSLLLISFCFQMIIS